MKKILLSTTLVTVLAVSVIAFSLKPNPTNAEFNPAANPRATTEKLSVPSVAEETAVAAPTTSAVPKPVAQTTPTASTPATPMNSHDPEPVPEAPTPGNCTNGMPQSCTPEPPITGLDEDGSGACTGAYPVASCF